MSIKRIDYNPYKKVSGISIEQNTNYIWVSFEKNSENVCIIEKQFAFDTSQVFFSLEREVDGINAIYNDGTNLYVAYNDDNIFGERIRCSTPLTSTTELSFPLDVIESPVDIKFFGSSVYYLTPGIEVGENAKIIKYASSNGSFQETIDLTKSGTEVKNASSFIIDSLGDIWIVTNESPANVVRVFDDSGWDFEITEINDL